MATTLISFLGVGRKHNPGNPRSRYEQTTYRFEPLPNTPASPFTRTTSLFSLALLDYLTTVCQDTVERWIILGTNASLWSELYQLLDPDQQNRLEEEYIKIDDHVISKSVNHEILSHWEKIINQHVDNPKLSLHLIDPFQQEQLADVLMRTVPRSSKVVLDISHGFRHLPILATHVLNLMRWTHDVRSISYYSGVSEARNCLDEAPVFHLSLCQDLMDLTESLAVFRLTGNYQSLIRQLLNSQDKEQTAELVWFLENTNQLSRARAHIQQLIDSLQQLPRGTPSFTSIVGTELSDFLSSRHYDDEWFYTNAREALEHQNYLHAIILTYEAILIRVYRLRFSNINTSRYEIRKQAEEYLYNYAHIDEDQRNLFRQLQWIRNACTHGTRPDKYDPVVEAALADPNQFCRLIRLGWKFYRDLPQLLSRSAGN